VFVTIGPDASTISELVTSIESALTLQDSAALYSGSIVSLSVVETQPLAMLVSELKHDERLNRFAQRVLAPLLDYDERNDGDLVRVLSAYLRHPTNRSQAASAANLSRSVFYQRLDMIESVLAADLTDGTTLATLTLALQVAPHLAAPA
jgi:purine catabolism regulator